MDIGALVYSWLTDDLYKQQWGVETWKGGSEAREFSSLKAPVFWCELSPCIILVPDVLPGSHIRDHSALWHTLLSHPSSMLSSCSKLRVLLSRFWSPWDKNSTILYTDPNSAIQASYFSRSAADTDFDIFLSVRVKSSMVTGICSSSLDRARISSGLRPWIRRRIAIIDASLMYMCRQEKREAEVLVFWITYRKSFTAVKYGWSLWLS